MKKFQVKKVVVVALSIVALLVQACGSDPAPQPLPQLQIQQPQNPGGYNPNFPQNNWGSYGQLQGGTLFVYGVTGQLICQTTQFTIVNSLGYGVSGWNYTCNGYSGFVANGYTYPYPTGYGFNNSYFGNYWYFNNGYYGYPYWNGAGFYLGSGYFYSGIPVLVNYGGYVYVVFI